MESFELASELVVINQPLASKPEDWWSVPTDAAVIAVVSLAVILLYRVGGYVRLPTLPIPALILVAACGCGNDDDIVVAKKTQPLTQYTSTVLVRRTTPLREAFGVDADVKKAWLIRATFPGDEPAMYQSLRQVNNLMAAKDMRQFRSDDERAEFISKCYTAVGFTDVQLVDPDK